ncbi:MAG: histidine ammonia-lyase [Bacillota bacterium]
MGCVLIDGTSLKLEDFAAVVYGGCRVKLSEAAKSRVEAAAQFVQRLSAQGVVVYGVTTGFGALSRVSISPEQAGELQENLVLSHACGVGEPFPEDVVRGAMLLRANTLARGHSGVRVQTLQLILDMLNEAITPVVPCQGSVGASGDLVPLAHLALALIGRGQVSSGGRVVRADEELRAHGLSPLGALAPKEGLALINGTAFMCSMAAIAVLRASNLCRASDIAASMTFEALRGLMPALDERLAKLRPHPGHGKAARNMSRLLEGSAMTSVAGEKVQDAYSLRCVPQVHGATKDAVEFVKTVVETEMNSVTDNPVLFPEDGEVVSGGNFHGQPLAIAMDFLAMAVAELGDISERRISRLIDPHLSCLPPFLACEEGLNSGLMVPQYVAAALVSENKTLCHPACVDSIPTSANQEDHVSMGSWAARKALRVLDNVERVLAIELLTAAQALEFLHPLTQGRGTAAAYSAVRRMVPALKRDRELYRDIGLLVRAIASGALVREVESSIGPLE